MKAACGRWGGKLGTRKEEEVALYVLFVGGPHFSPTLQVPVICIVRKDVREAEALCRDDEAL